MVEHARGQKGESKVRGGEEADLPVDPLWIVTGPGGVMKLIEAPTWYLARERFTGATPMDCDACVYEGIGALARLGDHEWKVVGTLVSG